VHVTPGALDMPERDSRLELEIVGDGTPQRPAPRGAIGHGATKVADGKAGASPAGRIHIPPREDKKVPP
jgi:hypothetical protein